MKAVYDIGTLRVNGMPDLFLPTIRLYVHVWTPILSGLCEEMVYEMRNRYAQLSYV